MTGVAKVVEAVRPVHDEGGCRSAGGSGQCGEAVEGLGRGPSEIEREAEASETPAIELFFGLLDQYRAERRQAAR